MHARGRAPAGAGRFPAGSAGCGTGGREVMTARTARADLTVGVAAPHDLVERIMLSAVGGPGLPGAAPPRRMVAAAYRDEREAADKVGRLSAAVDAWLFASPVPLARARAAGVLQAPAVVIPLGGSALYAALLRSGQAAAGQAAAEPLRVSVDLIGRSEVEEAFADLGLPAAGVQVLAAGSGGGQPGGAVTGAAELAALHQQLWHAGSVTAAFTCLPSVAARLAAAGMTAYPVRPTGEAIRAALRTAVLLGQNRRLERAQLAVIAIEVPVLRETAPRRALAWSGREELRLAVHRMLIQQARRMRACVSPAGEHCFLVTITAGSLAAAGWPAKVPFAEAVLAELGVELEIGVGAGADADEAASRAWAAAQRAGRDAAARTPDEGEAGLVPAPRRNTDARPASPRGLEILARLAAALPAGRPGLVVDAETSGQLLGVTPRTARRLLHTLVEEGMAWPLPPSRVPQPGRPRQAYRLLVEKLQPAADS